MCPKKWKEKKKKKGGSKEFPLWHSKLRFQRCHSCGLDSVPGLGTSMVWLKKKKKEEVRAMRGRAHMCHDAKCAISELMSHPRVKANQIAMTLC